MPRRKKPNVPPEIREIFVRAIEREASGPFVVPEPLPLSVTLRFFWDWGRAKNRMLHVLPRRADDGRYFLDFLSSSNDGETSYHGRIHEDGREEDLENYQGQVSMPVLATPEETERERERIWAHNAQVEEILRSKGFF